MCWGVCRGAVHIRGNFITHPHRLPPSQRRARRRVHKTTELPKFEGRGRLSWRRALFPNCLAASDKHKKPGQMDTDLGQESRDFLTQDPQGSWLSKKGSVLSSHPQNRGLTA